MPRSTATSTLPPLFYTDTHHNTYRTPLLKLITIFIHGLRSSSNFYAPIIPPLSHLTRCIAVDLPGSGFSPLPGDHEVEDEPPEDELSISSMAEAIARLIESLKLEEEDGEKVIIVGHSMGGIVANALAAWYPEMVDAVVLLGPVAASPEISRVFDERIRKVQTKGLEALADTIPKAATSPSATDLSRAFVRTLILGTDPEAYIALCRAIVTAPSTVEMGLRNVKCPLLVLVGEDDKTAPLSMGERICDAYGTERRRKEVMTLEGVGHWYCVEKPELIVHEIYKFLVLLE